MFHQRDQQFIIKLMVLMVLIFSKIIYCRLLQRLLPDASLLLAGDFNSRCGNLQDILYDDNVDYIFDQDSVYEADDFHMTRNSKDLTQNAFGVSLIEVCKIFSMHIVNGRSNKYAEGEITCIANDARVLWIILLYLLTYFLILLILK